MTLIIGGLSVFNTWGFSMIEMKSVSVFEEGEMQQISNMNVLDLFSGIGGFSLGLERAGMKTVAFCEIGDFPRKVLRKHWPDVPIFEDIKELHAEDIKETIDVICGEDTRVKGRVLPGSEGAQKMTAGSGRNIYELYKSVLRLGLLAKILLGTSVWGSTLCFLTWKTKVTPGGRILFQLVPSGANIDETGFGLWPTPLASDHKKVSTKKYHTERIAQGRGKGDVSTFTVLIGLTSDGNYRPEITETLMGYPEGWTEL